MTYVLFYFILFSYFQSRNQHYVTQLEVSLARAMINTPEKVPTSAFDERIDSENDFEELYVSLVLYLLEMTRRTARIAPGFINMYPTVHGICRLSIPLGNQVTA